jgi:hypothetical protein
VCSESRMVTGEQGGVKEGNPQQQTSRIAKCLEVSRMPGSKPPWKPAYLTMRRGTCRAACALVKMSLTAAARDGVALTGAGCRDDRPTKCPAAPRRPAASRPGASVLVGLAHD